MTEQSGSGTSLELYPDVTGDPLTWPVLYRYVDSKGEEIVCYDPEPWDRKQHQQATMLTIRREENARRALS